MGELDNGATVVALHGGGAGITYVEFEYEADIAASATYTPAANMIFNHFWEILGVVEGELEWYDAVNTNWTHSIDERDEQEQLFQGPSQRFRCFNDDTTPNALGVYGVIWAGYAAYEYETDLAGGANYVPPAQTFFSWAAESISNTAVNLEWYDQLNATWRSSQYSREHRCPIYQSALQRTRLINDGGAFAIGLYGATWT